MKLKNCLHTAAAILALAAGPAIAQSLDVGDEVIFSGGPSQPPRLIQTGFSLHVTGLRYTGPMAGPATGAGKAPVDTLGSMAAPGLPPAPPPPLVAYDLPNVPLSKLGELVGTSTRPLDRFSAVRALGRISEQGRAAAVPILIEALGDEDLRVAAEGARSLALLRDPRAARPLIELLNQSDLELLEAVIRALGDLGDRRARAPLEPFVDGSGGRLDLAAREATRKLGR